MMTEAEIKRVVSEAVEETLTKLGVQVDDPIEVQKDMGFLHSWRTSTAAIGRHGMLTAVGVVVVGLLGLIWLSIKGGQP